MNKKYLSKLAIISLFIFPFGINSILLSEEKRKSLFDNFAYDTWNDLLKESDKYEKNGLFFKARESLNKACKILDIVARDIGADYVKKITISNYKELNSELISNFQRICDEYNLNTFIAIRRIAFRQYEFT